MRLGSFVHRRSQGCIAHFACLGKVHGDEGFYGDGFGKADVREALNDAEVVEVALAGDFVVPFRAVSYTHLTLPTIYSV